MKRINELEMRNINAGSIALVGFWAAICGGFCWGMAKLGDYGMKSVKRKKR